MKKITYGKGNSVYCDDIILDGQTIVAVSMIGRESLLRAVCAALIDGDTVTLSGGNSRYCYLQRPKGCRCSFKKIALGDGIFQGIFYNIEEKDRITTRKQFFLTINALFKYPFHEAWADFIFNKTIENGQLIELDVFSDTEKYYKIILREDQFAQMIFDNIESLKNLIN